MAESKENESGGNPAGNILATLKDFETLSLIGLALALVFLVFQLVPDWRLPWLPNFLAAAGAGFLLWSQGRKTKGFEEKACKYGLLAVAALFLWRDYYISELLGDYQSGLWWFTN